MGWSCRADAAKILDLWSKACRASTGTSNTWAQGARQYLFELSRTEHDDGAITGAIWRLEPSTGDRFLCYRSGTFRIEGDGKVTRAPAFLRRAS